MNYKICTKCGEEFPATSEFFNIQKRGKFGLRSICKPCVAKYRQVNKVKITAQAKRYRQINKEKLLVQRRKYQQVNKEKITAQQRRYQQINREKIAVRQKKYRKDNPDKINNWTAKYRAKKFNQTPVLTEEQEHQMKLIYKKCYGLGSDWHVDHIRPISKGGLHHIDNLQIVTAQYNLQKHDKLNFRLPTDAEMYKFEGSLLVAGKEEVS